MISPKKIKVLIVDDSVFFREALSRTLSDDAGIEVIGLASSAFEARAKLKSLNPDVITLDIEMPRMNGIEFLRSLLPDNPIPVVVVSSVNSYVFEAMDAGAVDFVTKPGGASRLDITGFTTELAAKIKTASVARVRAARPYIRTAAPNTALSGSGAGFIIAIGASTGGTDAILSILRELPPDAPGIVIVQHMPPVFTRMYAERLDGICRMKVKEAANGDRVAPGIALIAAGDKHMRLMKDGLNGGFFVKCETGEKVSGHCPSIDVLFDSVADAAASKAVGVILTGMGADGAKGLLKMKKTGAFTIGQDKQSCVVYGMPMVAMNIGAVDRQLALPDIPAAILNHISVGK